MLFFFVPIVELHNIEGLLFVCLCKFRFAFRVFVLFLDRVYSGLIEGALFEFFVVDLLDLLGDRVAVDLIVFLYVIV